MVERKAGRRRVADRRRGNQRAVVREADLGLLRGRHPLVADRQAVRPLGGEMAAHVGPPSSETVDTAGKADGNASRYDRHSRTGVWTVSAARTACPIARVTQSAAAPSKACISTGPGAGRAPVA